MVLIMKLQDYIDLIETTQGQAAKDLDVERPYLSQIIHGTRPGQDLVRRIRVWSKGAVKVKDLPGWENFE